jgi:uncharacterized protein YpuA (DUF1002 family)
MAAAVLAVVVIAVAVAASGDATSAVDARLEIRSTGDGESTSASEVGARFAGGEVRVASGERKSNTPAARKRPAMIAQMNLMRS